MYNKEKTIAVILCQTYQNGGCIQKLSLFERSLRVSLMSCERDPDSF